MECVESKKNLPLSICLVLDNDDADILEHMDMPAGVVLEGVQQGLEEFERTIEGCGTPNVLWSRVGRVKLLPLLLEGLVLYSMPLKGR
jgi:hypothetical protein